MTSRFLMAAALALTLAAAGCGDARTVGGTEAGCGSCHGFPPATAAHASVTAHPVDGRVCAPCHPTSVDAATGAVIPVTAGGTHANGTVEAGHGYFGDYPGGTAGPVDGSIHGPAAVANIKRCKACHGDNFDGTPTAPSCNACHTTNGHADWQTDCTFCHDPRVSAPFFHTRISTTAVSPPECSACHGAGYSETSKTVDSATHMDGTVNIPGVTCTSCHGTAGVGTAPRPAAPPVDKLGRTMSAEVGAHAAHLDGKTFSNGFACTSCHAAVLTYGFTHADGVPQVSFGSAVVPGGSYAAGTCSSVYCHGATLAAGGSDTAPNWAGSVTCTSCHANPPATGRHALHMALSFITCSSCHAGYATTQANSAVTVNKTVHVNGTKDVAAFFDTTTRTCGGCHTAGSRTWDP